MNAPDREAVALVAEAGGPAVDAVRLAEVVSLAVRVDRPLLRRARLELLPGAGPEAEADLWLGPLVESRGLDGFVLRSEVADWLRRRLARDQRRLRRASELVREMHAYLEPVLRLEERLTWWSLRSDKSDDEIQAELARVLLALRDPRRRTLRVWYERASGRFPERLRATDAAARLRLAVETLAHGDASAARAEAGDWRTLVSKKSDRRLSFRVRLARGLLEMVPASPGDGGRETSAQLDLPDTVPLLVEVRSTADGERRGELLTVKTDAPSRLVVGERPELRLADGRRWAVVERPPEPPPAAGVVYLTETSADDLRETRAEIALDLESHGYAVVPEGELPPGDREFESVVRGHLESSVLAIHLLAETGRGARQLELDLREGHGPSLIWIPPHAEDPEAVSSLLEDDELYRHADFVRSGLEDFKTLVYEELAQISGERGAAGVGEARRSVYLLRHVDDREAIRPLEEHLRRAGFQVSTSGEEARLLLQHASRLRASDALLVYCGDAAPEWMRETLREVTWHAVYGRPGPPRPAAVYVARPGAEKSWRPKVRGVRVLSGAEPFDPAPLEPFVDELRHGVSRHPR